MATTSQIRFLKNGSAGTPTDLLLPVFGGEIITAYEESNHITALVNTKTIATGNTLKFPASWKIGSEYHEAGEELLGLDVSTREYSISLEDRPLVSHFETDDIDSLLAHFEIRSQFAMETGRELARQNDKNVLKGLILASRAPQSGVLVTPLTNFTAIPDLAAGVSASYYTGEFPAGARYVDTNFGSSGVPAQTPAAVNAVLTAISKTAIHFDKLNVPETDRHVVIPAETWFALRQTGSLVVGLVTPSSGLTTVPAVPAYGSPNGMAGPSVLVGTAKNEFLMYLGFKIWRTTHLPYGSNLSASGPTKWQGNYTNSFGVIFQKDGYAHLQKLGVTSEMFRDVRRQSDFYVAKTYVGGGTLRPCAVVELRDSAATT